MAPRDQEELEAMLEFSVQLNGPVAIRYPRGGVIGKHDKLSPGSIKLGKAEVLSEGKDLAIFAIGSSVYPSLEASRRLAGEGIKAGVINARFIKPLDEELILNVLRNTKKIVTVEEGIVEGGFGSAILELMEKENIKGVKVKRIGFPSEFIEHGGRVELLKKYNLTSEGIYNIIKGEMLTL